MPKRDIGKEVIEGLQEIKAWRRGEKSLKTTAVEGPRAVEVPSIRRGLGLSQEQFAELMGVSVATLRNWEQGRREPQGPARSLLLIASLEPATVLNALMTSRGRGPTGRPTSAAEKAASYRVSRKKAKSHLGIRPFPKRGKLVTNRLINKLRRDDAY